ncbi:MAG: FAD-dependent oxidoreductase [Clostridiales bacterium]|nr:FAD-dependent oxidoreductase [Clostridiales bacterium]
MRDFEHINAKNFEEAGKAVASNKNAVAIAGGTDLFTEMKDFILPQYPETLVNLKTISDGAYIRVEEDTVSIGATTKLTDIVESKEHGIAALTEAAHSVASPLVRNLGTIGGNICQDVRCWYYRFPEEGGGVLNCARKGGSECYAIRGDNRYHSIMGGMKTTHGNSCSMQCPAGTDISSYMEKLREGDVQGAADILIEYNPMPAITGRVCAHFCQSGCNRGHVAANQHAKDADDPVSVHSVERFLGDYIFEHADRYYSSSEKKTGKKIALVGAGPAGLSAAYYLSRAGHDVDVYDKMEKPGGMLMYAIPNYRLPKHYVEKLVSLLEGMGVTFKTNVSVGEDIPVETIEKEYDKVFYATGAWKRPVLGFDGEEFTEFGLAFLIEVNQWLNKKKREHVLVVGGGNVAMDVAVTAKRLGAGSVTLACLEPEDRMPASSEEVARAVEEGIKVMPSWGVARALYEDDKVVGMELKRCASPWDENGRFNPVYDDNETITINADSVLMAAGQRVDLSFLKDKYELAVERGRIKVDETQETSRKDVYAGGDAVTGPSTAISAIRAGRNAADSINSEYGIERSIPGHGEGFLRYDEDCLNIKRGIAEDELSIEERSLDKEDSQTVSKEQALAEAKRCMNCGCYSVNASDIANVLLCLDADIITTEKTIKATDFFTTEMDTKDMLNVGELVKEIKIPKMNGYVTGYDKFRLRESIDFAILSLAYAYKADAGKMEDLKLVFGAAAPVPVKATEVEDFVRGKTLTADVIEEASELAVKDTLPMAKNAYKVQNLKIMVKRLLEKIAEES